MTKIKSYLEGCIVFSRMCYSVKITHRTATKLCDHSVHYNTGVSIFIFVFHFSRVVFLSGVNFLGVFC